MKRSPWLAVSDILAFAAGVAVVAVLLAVMVSVIPFVLLVARTAWGLL